MTSHAKGTSTTLCVGFYLLCSMCMMPSNKLALQAVPHECTLIALHMAICSIVLVVFARPFLHFGSCWDVFLWTLTLPVFTSMILSNMKALKTAPMTLVITFRGVAPLLSLVAELFFPNPPTVTILMLMAVALMIVGVAFYVEGMPATDWGGAEWVLLNTVLSVTARCSQRLFLAREHRPVDISLSGIVLLNNSVPILAMAPMAWLQGEFAQVGPSLQRLDTEGIVWIVASCVVCVGISYSGPLAQSMISTSTFLVLSNMEKFLIIFVDIFFMKTQSVKRIQLLGAFLTLAGGCAFCIARERVVDLRAREPSEKKPLIAKMI